jgi:ring-1,2-phenylacetyl-CoA epoxidase subunit PaaD
MDRPSCDEVWGWLAQIEDPEIPVISIVDLGVIREVKWEEDGDGAQCVVAITTTYSGCPATHVIQASVEDCLRDHGLRRARVVHRISPPWTTDWMSEEGKRKLRDYGIAPPVGLAAQQAISIAQIGRGGRPAPFATPLPHCPRCDSPQVSLTSEFGSTPCKALYRCLACLEPFDHFKCH